MEQNPDLTKAIEKDSPIKEWLVDYVGQEHDPEDGDVTVEMIIDTMANEFPEFLMVLAEENWIRGYQQAMFDIDDAEKEIAKLEHQNELTNDTES
tara:strand:+ start:1944 stop:2228 length:285 start_codon:yes stop_codon:yes gene_type:complete